jgi:hypothetical protein
MHCALLSQLQVFELGQPHATLRIDAVARVIAMLVAAPAIPVPSAAPADTNDAAPQTTAAAAAANTGTDMLNHWTEADFKSLAAVLGIESCIAAVVLEAISALKGSTAAAAVHCTPREGCCS